MSEEDLGSLQDGVGTVSRTSYTSTASERQSESTFDDLLGEFGEASAPRADMDDFDIEMVSSASNQPSEASEASSAATGPPRPGSGEDKDGGPAYSYPMGFEMNDQVEEVDDDIIPEMEATLMPVRQERSLSFGAAEVIEYEEVVIKDEDLIGADREMNDDDDDEDDEEIDMHFPAGAADDYRAPNKDHLITNADDTGFDDPFEHHHTRSEEDSEEDLEKEEIRKIPGARDGACSDEEGNLREGAVNRTGFADDVVDDELDKAEIRNYTEARTKAEKLTAHVGGSECHYNERTDRDEKQQLQQSEDSFGFGEDDHYDYNDDRRHHQDAAQVTHTSRQSLVLVSTHTTWCCIT